MPDDPLVRYWDDVVRDRPALPVDLDPALTDPIHRVHALDDAPAPDRLFVNALWEELMHATAPLTPNGQVATNGIARSRPHTIEWPGTYVPGSRHRWRALATAALLILVLGGTFVAFGWPRHNQGDRSATVPAVAATPQTVADTSECQIEPRSIDEVMAFWYPNGAAATPDSGDPEPGSMTSVPAPLGKPADALTEEGIKATAREITACGNAEDQRRIFALFSDNLMRRLGAADIKPSLADARASLEATPNPDEEQTRLLAVTDVSVMADGRVGAFIVFERSSDGVAHTELIVFVQERGRWVMDDFVVFEDLDD